MNDDKLILISKYDFTNRTFLYGDILSDYNFSTISSMIITNSKLWYHKMKRYHVFILMLDYGIPVYVSCNQSKQTVQWSKVKICQIQLLSYSRFISVVKNIVAFPGISSIYCRCIVTKETST